MVSHEGLRRRRQAGIERMRALPRRRLRARLVSAPGCRSMRLRLRLLFLQLRLVFRLRLFLLQFCFA